MRTTQIPNAILVAAAITMGGAGLALAQMSGADPHHPGNLAQATPQSGMGGMMGQGQGAMPGGSGMIPSIAFSWFESYQASASL